MSSKKSLFLSNYLSLAASMVMFVLIGWVIGSLTKTEISSWYKLLNRSPLTPPNYMFSIVWTALYVSMGACVWILWRAKQTPNLWLIKNLYVFQLLLNWAWSPLFFGLHKVGTALLVLLAMDLLVAMIVALAYKRVKMVALLTMPYLSWILFATYLNFYIWKYN